MQPTKPEMGGMGGPAGCSVPGCHAALKGFPQVHPPVEEDQCDLCHGREVYSIEMPKHLLRHILPDGNPYRKCGGTLVLVETRKREE